MQVKIADIHIGERYRKDMGDIEGLARSMNEIGLLHPVAIDADYRLIAGERRILAARLLGWESIEAHFVDLENLLQGERDENMVRKEFTVTEAVAIARALEPIERAAAKERQGQRTDLEHPAETAESLGDARDKIAQAIGMGRTALSQAIQVIDAAEQDPERFGDLAERLDGTGNQRLSIAAAHREYNRRKAAETIPEIAEPDGKYSTIVIDPPWDWGDEGDVSQMGRSVPKYATMPIDEIERLPIPELAADNCHLYLWITNRSLPKGFRLLEAWGFRYITALTWCKPSIGIGNYFRNNTEHILFGVKGSMRLLRFDMGTWFQAPRGSEHSSKPAEAYEIIASCSPEPRLDMFARSSHWGFIAWGNSSIFESALLGPKDS